MAPKRGRSQSMDPSEADSNEGSEQATVKKSNAGDRKAQNRISQRQFRERKQAHLQNLEKRVADFDSQQEDNQSTIAALREDNQQLRQLVQSLSTFIGDGLGGSNTNAGLPNIPNIPPPPPPIIRSPASLYSNSYSTTDGGMADTYRNLAAGGMKNAGEGYVTGGMGLMGPGMTLEPPRRESNSFPLPPQLSSTNSYPPSFVPTEFPTHRRTSIPYTKSPSTIEPSLGMNTTTGSSMDIAAAGKLKRDIMGPMLAQPVDNRKLQAIQLISYHMGNKRSNPSYHLPPALNATVLQKSIPHDTFFDGVIFASLRDRLILCKDQYNIAVFLTDYTDGLLIHDNDILQPENWELKENFLTKYWFVIEADVLAISNRWRKSRGERVLEMRDIVPDGDSIGVGAVLGKKLKTVR